MPIYAYKCSACGHEKDVLQKLSEPPLTDCPACGQAAFGKQLTAAGFQLKGSGWYVTDFKNGSKKPDGKGDVKPDAKPETKAETKPEAKPGATSDVPAKSPSAGDGKPAPAAAGGTAAS